VRLPGLRIRRLRLNRHLPEVDLVAEHAHPFGQLHCYLSGHGTVVAEGRKFEAEPGTVVFLPPRRMHAFQEAAGRRPLCLVLDLEWRGAQKRGILQARLSQAEAGSVRHELSEITKLADATVPECRVLVASVVLRILDILLRRLEVLPARPAEMPAYVRRFEALLRQDGSFLPEVGSLAARLGYQMDYLNRIFKRATGQTLREFRDAVALERASRLLRENKRVKEVCEALGCFDQNYFARWFRKQTGVQPRAFAGVAAAELGTPSSTGGKRSAPPGATRADEEAVPHRKPARTSRRNGGLR